MKCAIGHPTNGKRDPRFVLTKVTFTDRGSPREVRSVRATRRVVEITPTMKAVSLTLTILLLLFNMQQSIEAVRLGLMNGNIKYNGARIRVGDIITNVALILNIYPDSKCTRPKIDSNHLRKNVQFGKSNFQLRI